MSKLKPEDEIAVPDVEKLRAALYAHFGGEEEFFRQADARVDAFNKVWDRDASDIGDILHAHLVVEHYLLLCAQHQHPSLPDLSTQRLKYDQRLALLSLDNPLMKALLPGLRKLNKIRNDLAHQLHLEVVADDVKAMLACAPYTAMRKAGGYTIPEAPAKIVVDFAHFAASMLNTMAAPDTHIRLKAFADARQPDEQA
jgi:hypothetical protein